MKTESNPISDEAILELDELCTADRRKVIGIVNEETASCYMKIALRELGIKPGQQQPTTQETNGSL